MSMHKTPLTELERAGLVAHGLVCDAPSQLSDAFRLGIAWAQKAAQAVEPDWIADVIQQVAELGDRNSPEDQPEMMLVSGAELCTILEAAHPAPAAKPLSDEQMRRCCQAMDAEPLAEGWPELIKFARAIEAAHGIKEQS